jgi:hypothetical protein
MNRSLSVDLGNPKRSDLLSAVSDGKFLSTALPPLASPTQSTIGGHGVYFVD